MVVTKKGVSPLVATVLLVSFAVALGAVVMNWAGSLSGGSLCNQASIDLSAVCYDPVREQIRATATVGESDLSGVQIRVIGDRGQTSGQDLQDVGAGTRRTFVVAYAQDTSGQAQSVEITPLTKNKNSIEVCSEHALSVSNIAPCAS